MHLAVMVKTLHFYPKGWGIESHCWWISFLVESDISLQDLFPPWGYYHDDLNV